MQFDQSQVHNEDIQLKNTRTDDASKWAPNEWAAFAKGHLYPAGHVDIERGGVQYKNQDTAYHEKILRKAFPIADVSREGIAANTYPTSISNDHLLSAYNSLNNPRSNRGSMYTHDDFMGGLTHSGVGGGIIGRH